MIERNQLDLQDWARKSKLIMVTSRTLNGALLTIDLIF
ncbi:hypothetical protein DOT_3218 [Desulfosporosinus sp. OT]|nr:hypothetical protein DOT_3218 [Desulfosporosinus sp. OT]